MDDSVVTDLLKTFYKARSKADSVYDYSPEGDLVEMDKSHKTVLRTVLQLNEYRPITDEEREEMEQTRNEAIALATQQYNDAKKRLKEASVKPDRSDTEYLRLMREVRMADDVLFHTRFPVHYIEKVKQEKWKRILFDEMENDTRVIPYHLCVLQTSPFLLKDMYVRVGKQAEKPLMTVKEIKKAQKASAADDLPVILFSSTDDDAYGFLSLDWKVDISLRGATYHSARQALSVELAKLYGDNAHVQEFMEMESPEGIRYTLDDVPEEKGIDRSRWTTDVIRLLYEIHTEKFSNYPALALQLIETGNAHLGASEPGDALLGIGLAIDNPLAKRKLSWTGQNMIGKSIMDIREMIQKQQEALKKKEPAARTMKRVKPASVQSITEPPVVTTSTTAAVSTPSTSAVSASSSSTAAEPLSNIQPSQPRVMRRIPKKAISSAPTSSDI